MIYVKNNTKYGIHQIREDMPNVSIPDNADLTEWGYYSLIETSPPEPLPGYKVIEVAPINNVQTWDQIEYTQEELEEMNSIRIANLWQAAHDYEFAQISGSAIGLLVLGVLQSKPKCTAVQNWIQSIWTTYYTRKASGSSDTDYTGSGAIPYTVPELMAELGF